MTQEGSIVPFPKRLVTFPCNKTKRINTIFGFELSRELKSYKKFGAFVKANYRFEMPEAFPHLRP